MADTMRVMGLHNVDCWAFRRSNSGDIVSPWYWQEACENDSGGRVMVPCACDECGAYLAINTSQCPQGVSNG